MTVFIAHAEADLAAAEALQKYLERRGHFVERETGERGFRPLMNGDALVALWSKDSPFSPYRLQIEKRALDAWAEGRLILVELDRQFAPVGLRDLPFVDASFEPQRDLVAWAEVAKRAQEVRRAPPEREGPSTLDSRYGDMDRAMRGGAAPEDEIMVGARTGAPPPAGAPAPQQESPPVRIEPPRRAGAGLGIVTGLVVVIGAAAAAIWLAPGLGLDALGQRIGLDRQAMTLGLAGLAGVIILVGIIAAIARGASRPRPRPGTALKMKKASERKEAGEEQGGGASAVFVSYARADAPVVIPVCEAVKLKGNHLWIDQDGIGAGEGWAGEIVRAIRTVRGVAVMCSKAAFESDHVKREVYLADRYKKRLLPVFIEETPMPDDFEYFFAGVQQLKLHETPEAERAAMMARALAAV